ncbi:MAG: asparaginase domain-containing protein [Planctomycetota bacterium]|nr:asparaginase domain-containing protein [Planctomycetota bacterium]
MKQKRIALISTGGTIEKTYDELQGIMTNNLSNLDVMMATLETGGIEINRVSLMNKDSVEMTAEDHDQIIENASVHSRYHDGVVVIHGTDRLAKTGRLMFEKIGTPKTPIVLTGAMRPFALKNTDAMQNLAEALLAVQILEPGIYVVMHNKVLKFPGIVKDRARGTFVRQEDMEVAPDLFKDA